MPAPEFKDYETMLSPSYFELAIKLNEMGGARLADHVTFKSLFYWKDSASLPSLDTTGPVHWKAIVVDLDYNERGQLRFCVGSAYRSSELRLSQRVETVSGIRGLHWKSIGEIPTLGPKKAAFLKIFLSNSESI